MTAPISPGVPLRPRYDAIVVGAGIAGSLVAQQLGGHGWHVLVLEAGTNTLKTRDGYQDAIDRFHMSTAKVPNSPYRSNDAAPSPDVRNLQGNVDGTGYEANGYFVQRGPLPYGSDYVRAAGGAGLHWLGLTPRLAPEDFRTASKFGYGHDWPIEYETLQPWYEMAERALGVAGDAAGQADLGIPMGEYEYPMEAIPQSYVDAVCARGLDGKSVEDPIAVGTTFALRVVAVPHARNGRPNPRYNKGAGYRPIGAPEAPNTGERCVGNASCTPICPAHAKYTPLKTQAAFGPTVELLSRAVVTRVLARADGQVVGVEYAAYDDPAVAAAEFHTVEGDVIVIAAHAIENARLLLASGLANSSDQVGRNLMDHPVLLAWALLPEAVGPFRGPGSTSGIDSFRFGPARSSRAPFRIAIANWGWIWAADSPGRDVAMMLETGDPDARNGRGIFGTRLRAAIGHRVGRQLALQFELEQPADPANRVTIDPSRTDALGNERPIITYDLSDHVKRGIVAARGVSSELFLKLGATDCTVYKPDLLSPGLFEFRGERYAFHGAGHGAGTHVMGADRARSVVDEWQRCWDHSNLYAVGCGSMPSVGTANPTLTMAALALRTAEQIHVDLTGRHQAIRIERTPVRRRSE